MRVMEPEDLAAAIRDLNEWAQRHAPEREPEPRRRLRALFDAEPRDLPVITRAMKLWDRPNFQVAIDAFLKDRAWDLLGLVIMRYQPAGLPELARGGPGSAVAVGEADHVTVPLGNNERIVCVQSGLWLVEDDDDPLAIMLKHTPGPGNEELALQVMARSKARAAAVVAELWRIMSERNVYRGRVLELRQQRFNDHDSPLTVRSLPRIGREQIVLPAGILERVERTTFGISRHAERLRASGRHMRRGLLLHGPPGVGKTLTAMYLATQMPERTVVLLTGRGLGLIGPSVELAVSLAPAIVILEDVDLVAMERSQEPTNALLFELLNAMDGLDADHDVLFVLTTNAAQRIEPALAARPGRIDQAVELPLPDADGRRRLLALYGAGLHLALDGGDDLIAELEGSSPAYIRELLRRGALVAAEQTEGPLRVTERHLREAHAELRIGAAELTRSLLGGGDGSSRAAEA